MLQNLLVDNSYNPCLVTVSIYTYGASGCIYGANGLHQSPHIYTHLPQPKSATRKVMTDRIIIYSLVVPVPGSINASQVKPLPFFCHTHLWVSSVPSVQCPQSVSTTTTNTAMLLSLQVLKFSSRT